MLNLLPSLHDFKKPYNHEVLAYFADNLDTIQGGIDNGHLFESIAFKNENDARYLKRLRSLELSDQKYENYAKIPTGEVHRPFALEFSSPRDYEARESGVIYENNKQLNAYSTTDPQAEELQLEIEIEYWVDYFRNYKFNFFDTIEASIRIASNDDIMSYNHKGILFLNHLSQSRSDFGLFLERYVKSETHLMRQK